jgi:predicted DNA-binding protein with PD1-like motif
VGWWVGKFSSRRENFVPLCSAPLPVEEIPHFSLRCFFEKKKKPKKNISEMEDSKLESYYEDMKSRAPKGRRGGLGSSKGPKSKGAGDGASEAGGVYSQFVRAGESGHKTFGDDDAGGDNDDSDDADAADGIAAAVEVATPAKKDDKKKKSKSSSKKSSKSSKKSSSKSESSKKKAGKSDKKKRKRSPSPSSSSESSSSSSDSDSDSSASAKKSSAKKASKTTVVTKEKREPLTTSAPVAVKAYPMRLLPGSDLVGTLTDFCDHHGVAAGYIGCGAGSFSRVTLRLAEEEVRSHDANFELVSIGGTVAKGCHHIHVSVADRNGKTFGGHAFPGCTVRTTVELMLFVPDCAMSREKDEETGYDELVIGKAKK